MKCIVRSKFLGRENATTARKRRALVVDTNPEGTQYRVQVEGLPYRVWVSAKDVHFV